MLIGSPPLFGSRPIAYVRSKTASHSVQRDGVSILYGDQCWSGLKSFTAKEEKSGSTLRKTLFVLKKSDGLRDFAVFESVFVRFREKDRNYIILILLLFLFYFVIRQ